MINKIFFSVLLTIFLCSFSSAVLLSDQGTGVRNLNGSLLDSGNLIITLYDDSAAGNLIFNSTVQNAIINGSWNLMINPNLQYGLSYWKDYSINGEDLDFDGNERIEFQSPLGTINSALFVNLSIGSCPSGYSIKSIYSNGSVECQSVSGNFSIDLSNYSLNNQSQTFNGNITTVHTGFFGFLGSLADRITKLFVGDIDASGNIFVSGNVNATHFIGDGSLLTNLSYFGLETDPFFVAENSTLWIAINSKLAQSDQRYNDTALILSVNQTSNIMSLGFYNQTQINSLISGVGNSSFNQSLTDILYYSSVNILNFINHTQAGVYNDTSLILTTNSSLWSYINSNQGSWISNYNSTYNHLLGQQCPLGYLVNGTLSNGTFTCVQSTLSESDPLWTANSTSVLYIGNLPLENRTISHISNITGFSYNYNQTSPSIAFVNSQGFVTSSIANATYLLITDLPLANRTIVHCSNITGSNQNLCNIVSSSGNLFNQFLNTTSNVTFESLNATREIYVSNIAVKQWLYNQTGAFNYNQTASPYFYNQTASPYFYNQSQTFAFNYNQTASPYFYNQTGAFNYNQTASPHFYNQTVALLNSNASWGNNNISASTGFFGFLGNIASRITNIFVVNVDVSNNISVEGNVSARFYLGNLNYSTFPTTSCSGTDKVVGVNSSGGVVCGVDQTGSGNSLPVKYISILAGAVTDTNAPATERIVGNSQYLACTNVSGYQNFRYGFARSATNGAANAIVYMKYIVSPSTTITGSSYTNLSNTTSPALIYTTANLANLSKSHTMNDNLGDVCLGAFQVGGDGTLDPQWRNIWVELS
ncbi:MAG: hypothetical protein ACP5NS_01945 [Candidatus Pacearchaeota archaeon]